MKSLFDAIKRQRLFVAILLFVLCLGVGLMVNSYRECVYPSLVEETIVNPGLKDVKGLRILQITDIHNNMPALERAVKQAKDTQVDLVFFTGDLYSAMDRIRYSGDMIQLLSQLTKLAPSFACLGNHDTERLENTIRILKLAGFQVLRNSSTVVNIPRLNKTVKLVGLGDIREADFFPENCMLLKGDWKAEFPTIVLSHEPETYQQLTQYQWDIMFSGHAHGGQICLPGIKPLMLGKDECLYKGYYSLPTGQGVFVSPGLGYENLPRFRSPGEINILTID